MSVHPRVTRHLLFAALASAIAVTGVLPATARPVAALGGSEFVAEANEYRIDAGVAPVSVHAAVNQIAVERADQLARAKQLSHDMEYVKRRLAEQNVCWERLGEIIAYNGRPEEERIERFVYQWYNSDGHRAIMLGASYTHAGGSYTTASNGYHYAAMIFVDVCNAPTQTVSATPYTDIAGTKFERAITWLYRHGIMAGCRSTKFCPGSYLTRGQLASALSDGLGLPATRKDFYPDDDGTRWEDGINRLAAAGLTRGCGDGNYCPNQVVRRGQLATAIAWALQLPATSRDYFRDDDGSRHEPNINRIAAAGITSGCGDGRYCHTYRIRRGQTAGFLRNAFD